MPSPLIVAEFYSGLGGLHYGLLSALPHLSPHLQPSSVTIHPYDVNAIANTVYHHNHSIHPSTQDITSLTAEDLDVLRADIWLMSPPCQPYTRNGPRLMSKDRRAGSFLKMLEELPRMKKRPWGFCFEASDTFETLTSTLTSCNYTYQGFIMNPLDFGIPNSRPRFFLLAKQSPRAFAHAPLNALSTGPSILFSALNVPPPTQIRPISDYLDADAENEDGLSLTNGQLWKAGGGYDMVAAGDRRSCCFTKSYGNYGRGTGSVLRRATDEEVIAFAELLPEVSEGVPILDDEGGLGSQSGEEDQELSETLQAKRTYVRSIGGSPTPALTAATAKIFAHYANLRTQTKSHFDTNFAFETASILYTSAGKPRKLSGRVKRELDEKRGKWWEGGGVCPLEVLKARQFSWKEVAALQGFPADFGFPDEVNLGQRWKLLGNSLNVKIVEMLVRYLFEGESKEGAGIASCNEKS
ncbi:S-adenosyl-L-methionine-dependent methyltransferase [Chytridium lagenaria]|nr:S-adenosyl-L-methionine-dependent methyltransferase [Chytridium lagenaria]